MENYSQESHVVGKTNEEETLEEKITRLETENNKMREEFNMQRAKMKELFLQKEEELKRRLEDNVRLQDENGKLKNELDEAKSQLVISDIKIQNDISIERRKAQEEIASLQQVIHETVEESSCVRKQQDTEISKLKSMVIKIQEENVMLKSQLPREPQLDGPQISLSTVKTLARKVASQLGADALSLGPDNLEESMRKAQEDAEVLRSLVVPLEHEIKALKEKLRTTDDELQKCKEGQLQRKQQESGNSQETACDMCRNYEAQLVKIQETVKDLEKQLIDSERMLNVQKEDLSKEVEFRHEMELKWNEKKEEHKIKVAELSDISKTALKMLSETKRNCEQVHRAVGEELIKLTRDRESVQKHLITLQKQNENLIGKHSKHSHQLQSESINMPNNVEDLHLSLLKTHEELIMARVAQEVAEENEKTLRSEVNLLREEMMRESAAKEQQVSMLQNDISEFKLQLDKYAREQRSLTEREEKLDQLEKRLEEVSREKEKAESALTELKQRVMSLQQELDNSEVVQKDFVRLSQSLQVQLERIRQAGSEVRWQHEEDVDECPTCHVTFTVTKKKIHCRHCGHIFCQSCLSHVVNSGPKQRPSRVCDVCHTLLVQDTAPYFSKEPPHTPD